MRSGRRRAQRWGPPPTTHASPPHQEQTLLLVTVSFKGLNLKELQKDSSCTVLKRLNYTAPGVRPVGRVPPRWLPASRQQVTVGPALMFSSSA